MLGSKSQGANRSVFKSLSVHFFGFSLFVLLIIGHSDTVYPQFDKNQACQYLEKKCDF